MTLSCLELRLRALGCAMVGVALDKDGVRLSVKLPGGANYHTAGHATLVEAVETALARLGESSGLAAQN